MHKVGADIDKLRDAHSAWQRAYYAKNKAAIADRKRAYALAHPEEISAYRAANRVKARAYQAAYAAAHPEQIAAYHRANRWRRAAQEDAIKIAVMGVYGGPKCACCGETLLEGLTIDHVDGGGTKHRRETVRGNIYRWLKKNNYPAGFQVLCGTCNMAKRTSDHCPHEDLRIAWG